VARVVGRSQRKRWSSTFGAEVPLGVGLLDRDLRLALRRRSPTALGPIWVWHPHISAPRRSVLQVLGILGVLWPRRTGLLLLLSSSSATALSPFGEGALGTGAPLGTIGQIPSLGAPLELGEGVVATEDPLCWHASGSQVARIDRHLSNEFRAPGGGTSVRRVECPPMSDASVRQARVLADANVRFGAPCARLRAGPPVEFRSQPIGPLAGLR